MTVPVNYCPSCGARLEKDDRFCPACGVSAAAESEVPAPPSMAPPPQPRPARPAPTPPTVPPPMPVEPAVAQVRIEQKDIAVLDRREAATAQAERHEPAVGPAPPRPRRRRKFIVAAVALLLVGALVTVLAVYGEEIVTALGVGSRPPQTALSLSFSPQSSQLAAGTDLGNVFIWTASDGTRTARFQARPVPLYGIALNARGDRVALGYGSGIVTLHEVNGDEQQSLDVSSASGVGPVGHPVFVSFQSDERTIIGFDTDYAAVRFWDTVAGTQYQPIMMNLRGITASAMTPDHNIMALGDADGILTVWNLQTRQPPVVIRGAYRGPVRSVAVSPDGWWVASSGGTSGDGEDAAVHVWSVARLERVLTLPARSQVAAVAWSPDGRLVAGGGLQFATVWKAADGAELFSVPLN